MPEKVALIGSGNWGSAIATKMGINAAKCADFEDTVMMWAFEEYVRKRRASGCVGARLVA